MSLINLILLKSFRVCVADAMVDTGLAKLGYEYINIGSIFTRLTLFLFFLLDCSCLEMRTALPTIGLFIEC